MNALAVVFWVSVALLLYAHGGYPLLLLAAARAVGERPQAHTGATPSVSLIVAAHDEREVIAAKVADALALDWPRAQLEVVVCCDGCRDDTAAVAGAAGADLVLELPRSGKVRAQDAGVAAARGELLAFSDANASWEPDALRELAAAFEDPAVGYACGQIRFVQAAAGAAADNQEGLYWRYEMAVRAGESRLRSVTAGNGGIYAVRREAYLVVDERMGHDLSFPFNMVKRGWRAVYVPSARASEKMVPSIDGEFTRKRRMMSHAWPIVLRGGMLSLRGYGLRYGWMILSHRVLRYAAPALHLVALASNIALVGRGVVYQACLAAQLALLLAAAAAARVRARPFLLARYYVLMNASLAAGLWDYLRHGTPAGWEAPEGTR
ncbi:MAG TPA: glycosyltransferase [Solirubrobacteraceae bacterium]|nr:glycosyltransferase [Solirubrobacteraceae bacterium]